MLPVRVGVLSKSWPSVQRKSVVSSGSQRSDVSAARAARVLVVEEGVCERVLAVEGE